MRNDNGRPVPESARANNTNQPDASVAPRRRGHCCLAMTLAERERRADQGIYCTPEACGTWEAVT